MSTNTQNISNSNERNLPIKDKFTVTALYFLFLSLLLVGFSGYVSRVNFAKGLGISETPLDVILLTRNQIAKRSEALNTFRRGQSLINQEVRDIENTIRSLESEIRVTETELASLAIPIARGIGERRFGINETSREHFRHLYFSSEPRNSVWAANISRILSAAEFIDAPDAKEKIESFDNQIKSFFEELRLAEVNLAKLENERISKKFERDDLQHDLEVVKVNIDKAKSDLAELDSNLSVEANAIVESYKTALSGFLYKLIEIPTIILTLVVTIAAGGLGSVILYTRCYWKGEDRKLFLTVGEGVAAAVSIFLFAGAGMLMLTQSDSASKGQIELSPYMVAFIAFISGFMAEEAFNRIRMAGKNLFSINT